jgi:regulator of sirC expression with transglutaminase-like and TPR domain
MSRESREHFAAAVRADETRLDLACALLAAETRPEAEATGPALARSVAAVVSRLDDLADSVPTGGRPDERLRHALGAFGGEAADYLVLRSSLLPDVLRTRRGLPILVSTVWTEVARRTGIDCYGVGLPGHFVVGIDEGGLTEHGRRRVLVDPWRGGRLLPYDTARTLVEEAGHVFRREHLEPASPVDTIARMLANVRSWARPKDRAGTRLWATELALLLPLPAPALLRERAETLVEVGRHLEASAAFERYAQEVAGALPDEARAALVDARRARAHLN